VPGWMKESGAMEAPGQLKEEMKAAWAKYFVRFFEDYLSHGISFWGTTIQNEPSFGGLPLYAWQKMKWNATGERTFVADHLGPALSRSEAAKHVKIIALDDNRYLLPEWADEVYSDPLSSSFISGVAIHWYFGMLAPVSVLTATHNSYPDKFILATEACAGSKPPHSGPSLGSWERAEDYAKSIIEDLNNFVVGWIDWNIALDTEVVALQSESFQWSPIIINATADEFLKQPMHYALTHFSRFLRPGSRRVQSTTVGIDRKKVMLTAFIFEGQRIVTILNTIQTEQEIAIEEEEAGTSISLKVPPKSITTVI
ncbi:hypothetical protein PMAYCL1PPCAC_22940, partial [Pristionchus mayeri]